MAVRTMPSRLVALLLAAASLAQAHFTFVRIATNNQWHAPFRYIRNKTEPFTEPSTPEQTDPFQNIRMYNYPTYSTDTPNSVRCGRDNMAHAGATETLSVKAGDTVEVAHVRNEPAYWRPELFYGCPEGRGTCEKKPYVQDINHWGPLLIHLSPVPAGQDVSTYDGSGEWVKIYTLGLEPSPTADPTKPVNWLAYNFQKQPPRFVFRIPEQTPPGQYLMRVDIVWSDGWNEWRTPPFDSAQMYPSCVQLAVESESKAVLPKGVKIPEIFQWEQPGRLFARNVFDVL
ncbi:lytic polysaccharide monooxygenase [Periconia macrospinosa]|uniref:lytic cellulose monooxygenase (C4-dehydrogenating) n=1 Tax=Periconia macrospinosa TaxID=97972 RepID=A0A2V1DNF4_9PLEO|nr:lytic polysaccharide monooxygenase [Periconia macrospinosa]